MTTEEKMDNILIRYQQSFAEKVYSDENDDHDLLMDAFGITPLLKRENRQYWGRELGKCWESLVVEACKSAPSFQPPLRIGGDEPCDLRVEQYAIDTKYRVGSGDSGTLKKFRYYGSVLKAEGYTPVFLFLRKDNLPAAMAACLVGGWTIYVGKQSFDFIKAISGFDLEDYLTRKAQSFAVNR
ncbi:restriction endonuclease [Pseudomonas fragi]|nr:restriction endonuclease [Pseudomonas fragi]